VRAPAPGPRETHARHADRPPPGLLVAIVLAYILVPVLVSAYGTAEDVLVEDEERR
tara:strand:- start:139 stop:306 length:168 start_codon:yes stop_codon:yes gene_type:complete